MELVFIDQNSAIDNNTRSTIRRQAAKGQNLGRKITRPSRVKAFERQASVRSLAVVKSKHGFTYTHQESCKEDCGLRRDAEDTSSQVEPVIGDSISVLSLPVEVAQEDRALMFETVTFLNSVRYIPDLDKALAHGSHDHSIFVRLIFTDQAYYHCALAAVLECTQFSPQASVSTARHLIKAFRLINERISQAEQVSNSTLAVVMSLSTYESTRGRYKLGMIHLSGLIRMVEARGGLDLVGSGEPELMQKIYRADLDYALRLGTTPKLNIKLLENSKAMKRLVLPSMREQNNNCIASNLRFRAQLGPELCVLWDCATGLSTLINEASAGQRDRVSSIQFLRSYVWLGHRLLNSSPFNKPRSLDRVQNMAHLGLLMLVSSLLTGFDRRVLENVILSQLLRKEASLQTNHEAKELLLWLLFLGAAGILQDPNHDTWLIPKAGEMMQALGLNTWDSTKKILSKFPWMNDLYERGGSALFSRISSCEKNHSSISHDYKT
ncbi:hypothetical protein V8C35DRAFT_60745 [Trichoderma chlorosporum]